MRCIHNILLVVRPRHTLEFHPEEYTTPFPLFLLPNWPITFHALWQLTNQRRSCVLLRALYFRGCF